MVIDANRTPAEVAASLHAALAAHQPAPAFFGRLRALILAFGALLAGVTALGYQLAEAF